MNAHTTIAAADAAPADTPDAPLHPPLRASRRIDGWTADRQAAFLEHLADGVSVESACHMVGLSAASAYAFRRRAAGAAFALGWRAAALVARDRVADDLMARAFQGQIVTISRPDGSEVTRHYHDNRLSMALLARLDRLAEQASDADSRAVRLVAQEFDAFVDMIERDDSAPARAGLFLARRLPAALGEGEGADLGPVLALAACDRFARTGRATAAEVDIADLDPAARGDWSAEQWTRAESAGLVAVATPAPEAEPGDAARPERAREPEKTYQLPQRSPEPDWEDTLYDEDLVWWDEDAERWQTCFPPPAGFAGAEEGRFGDDDYTRDLTPGEEALVEPARLARIAEAEAERDAWFAGRSRPSADALPGPDFGSHRPAPER